MEGYPQYCASCWRATHQIGATIGIIGVWLTFIVDTLLHLFWMPIPLDVILLFSLLDTLALWSLATLAAKSGDTLQRPLACANLLLVAVFSGIAAAAVDTVVPTPFYWSVGFVIIAVAGAFPNRLLGALAMAMAILSSFCLGYFHSLEAWIPSLAGGAVFLTAVAPLVAVIGSISLDRALRSGFRSRRLAETAKDRLTITLRDIGDGVVVSDSQGQVVLFNRKAQEILGWSEFEAQQLKATDLFPWLSGPDAPNQPPHEIRVKTRNGEFIWLSLTVSQLDGLVVAFQDITERKHQEADRIRASRLESLGLVAGGIAHDFNNLLTAIRGNTSILLEQSLEDSVRTGLLGIEEASLRAGDLASQLLTFAKGGTPVKEVRHISELVRASSSFVLAGSRVRLEIEDCDELWCAEVDPTQIGQVVQNLTLNAVEAMPQGGDLRIRLGNLELKKPERQLKPGRYLAIEISDQGEGIEPELLDKIFDPYFTTKVTGSGLGLATAYSILHRHGGELRVDSQLGVGTTFTLYLPASQAKPKVPPPVSRSKSGPRKGGRILVMDDEAPVRRVLCRMLTRFGYRPTEACNGQEALEHFASALQGEPYCCVILDLTIPGCVGGEVVLSQLRELDPNVVAIVASGYAEGSVMSEYQRYGFSARLAKPFGIDQLRAKLDEVMNAAQS